MRLIYQIPHSLGPPVNCSDPTVPGNGSIETYQNTTEGAEILFGCNPQYSPPGRMRAVCAQDGRWNPDPGTLVCTGELISLQYMDYVLNPNHSCSELWGSLFCKQGHCTSIQQYSGGLRGILPVPAWALTRGEENLSVWRRWKVEPWSHQLALWRQDLCCSICWLVDKCYLTLFPQLTVESQGLLEMELLWITLVHWRVQLCSTDATLDYLVHRVY